jgi:AcrR family transcriptional regulator
MSARSEDQESLGNGQRNDTRAEVIKVAARLFAERGLDAVSVRDIVSAAGANLGAVNYHFGSKENLIHEIYDLLLTPVQRERVVILDSVEAAADGASLDLDQVLVALIGPAVRATFEPQGLGIYLPRLMAQAYAVPRPFLDDSIAAESDAVALRFIRAFARAVPDVPDEQMYWRYFFVIGCVVQVTSDMLGNNRLKRLSGNRVNELDPDRVIDCILTFCREGLRAPAPAR